VRRLQFSLSSERIHFLSFFLLLVGFDQVPDEADDTYIIALTFIKSRIHNTTRPGRAMQLAIVLAKPGTCAYIVLV
jgi:hypothetical protein